MAHQFDSQLTTRLRQHSAAVSGMVLLCILGQAVFPGVATSILTASTEQSEVTGCCVVDLSGAAASGCCCGPAAAKNCGCACGTKTSQSTRFQSPKKSPAEDGRIIQSEICGCGGEHRPGMITTIEPAVLTELDAPLDRQTDPQLPDTIREWPCRHLPPPTPPPEFRV